MNPRSHVSIKLYLDFYTSIHDPLQNKLSSIRPILAAVRSMSGSRHARQHKPQPYHSDSPKFCNIYLRLLTLLYVSLRYLRVNSGRNDLVWTLQLIRSSRGTVWFEEYSSAQVVALIILPSGEPSFREVKAGAPFSLPNLATLLTFLFCLFDTHRIDPRSLSSAKIAAHLHPLLFR